MLQEKNQCEDSCSERSKEIINLNVKDTVELISGTNCIRVNDTKIINCKYFLVIHPNKTIQNLIKSATQNNDDTIFNNNNSNQVINVKDKRNDNTIIKYNKNLYYIKEDDKYYRLIDKKTNVIKKIFKKNCISSEDEENYYFYENIAVTFDKKFVPQKENLLRISSIPTLIHIGINDTHKLSNFFGESRRHGSFYLNSCEILMWYSKGELTFLGKKLINLGIIERINLTKESIMNSQIFILLKKKFVDQLFKQNNYDLSQFLETELFFSKSTAKRRASTLVSWLNFYNTDVSDFIHETSLINYKYIYKNFLFESCYLDDSKSPFHFFLNCIHGNFDEEFMKILSIDKEKFKYTFFIFEKDEGRLELLMKLDFHFLKDRISYVIVPSYVTRLELFIRYIVENKDELNRLQRTVNC